MFRIVDRKGKVVTTIEMHFFAVECPDGTVHVQNYVGPYRGQHHIHTKESFEEWRTQNHLKVEITKGECNCGLKPGDVKEYDGQVWHNPKWEGK